MISYLKKGKEQTTMGMGISASDFDTDSLLRTKTISHGLYNRLHDVRLGEEGDVSKAPYWRKTHDGNCRSVLDPVLTSGYHVWRCQVEGCPATTTALCPPEWKLTGRGCNVCGAAPAREFKVNRLNPVGKEVAF